MSGFPSDREVRAYCFAHPCALSASLAARCAIGSSPLVYSISLGSDVICRLGPAPIREVRKCLGRLTRLLRGGKVKTVEQSKKEEDKATTESVMILAAWWRWKRLGGGQPIEAAEESRREIEELEEMAWDMRLAIEADDKDERGGSLSLKPVEDEMFSPGIVFHIDRLPAFEESRRRREVDSRKRPEDESEPDGFAGDLEQGSALYRVGDPAKFFKFPFLELDAISSHLPQQYLDAVESVEWTAEVN
jgi:hypothetical protein